MNRLAPGIFYIDLGFLAIPHVIATAVLHGRSGVALIDPGPSSTLHTLSGEDGHSRQSIVQGREPFGLL